MSPTFIPSGMTTRTGCCSWCMRLRCAAMAVTVAMTVVIFNANIIISIFPVICPRIYMSEDMFCIDNAFATTQRGDHISV